MTEPRVNNYLKSGGDYDIQKLESFLKDLEEQEILFWAIIFKKTGKHIGNIKIDPIDWNRRSGEYGIMMGDTFVWGKGYAFEASNAIIDFCFDSLIGLKSITLGVLSENEAALRLYYKLGFEVYKSDTSIVRHSGESKMSLRMQLLN